MPPTTDPPVPPLQEVAGFLEAIAADLAPVLDPPRPDGPGRPRVLPGLLLWGAVLMSVLERQASQRAIWRRISDLGLWHYRPLTISDQAVYHRLARDGTAPLERLFAQVTTLLTQRVVPWQRRELAPFASGVYAIDETTLDPVARRLAGDACPPSGRRLPGKLAGRLNLRTQLWERIALTSSPTQNEKVLARALVADLARDSLVLFDLGYFAFRWFDELTDAGLWYVSRWREGTSYVVLHTYQAGGESFDGIVWLGQYRADRAAEAVRLVRFPHQGTLKAYLTNVLDPTQLSAQDIAALYARRWDIERAVALVKQQLGLSLWWSTKDVVIHQQLWAVLTIAQIVQALRLEIAGRAAVDPFDVSVTLLVEQLPQYAARGWDPVARFVEVGRRMGYIRPARRVRIVVPDLDVTQYRSPPADLVTTREPRYAERKSLPRSA